MKKKILVGLATASITTGVCVAIAWWARPARPPNPRIGHERPLPSSVLERRWFPDEMIRDMHPRVPKLLVTDPVAHVLRRPNESRVIPWPEHPDGRFTIVTNAHSFREDEPTLEHTDATRIVVIGDSHIDGVVNNPETCSNLLEALLDEQADEGSYDVVNAAVPGVGPLEELGQIRRCLRLDPRLVVMVLFTGNDFQGALNMAYHFSSRPAPVARERLDLVMPIHEVRERWMAVAQGFHQAYDLKIRPDQFDLAVTATVQCYRVMVRLCRERSVGFLLVLLPSKVEVDEDDGPGHVDTILDELHLTREDYAVNRRLTETFVEIVEEELGVPVLDLDAPMRAAPYALFWNADHHLGLRGHELVARELVRPVLECLARGE